MKTFALSLMLVAMFASPLRADLYYYPEQKRPALSLEEALVLSKRLLAQKELGAGYYVTRVDLYGSEDENGGGAWTFHYNNESGDRVAVTLYFPEDECIVTNVPKNGKETEFWITREGKPHPKAKEQEEKERRGWPSPLEEASEPDPDGKARE